MADWEEQIVQHVMKRAREDANRWAVAGEEAVCSLEGYGLVESGRGYRFGYSSDIG